MSFFKKLFGKQNDNSKSDSGPMPTRRLNLQFAPIPENGHRLAQQFADAVRQNENIELDYSIGTLDFVDKFLQRFKNEGLTVNDFGETIFVAGSYVGQVMINNDKGIWIKPEDANLPVDLAMMPMVVKLPNGTIVDPITKAFKRFHNGPIDSIEYFYHVFAKH